MTPRAPAAELLRELVAREGGAWVTLVGTSMEPTLCRGERLRVLPAKGLAAGDVVLFDAGPHLVAHRVLARLRSPWGEVYLHAGDAWVRRSGLVHARRVIGRIAASSRRPALGDLAAGALGALGPALRLLYSRRWPPPPRPAMKAPSRS